MRFLLDENFPLGLGRALQANGLRVNRIITLGWSGASDDRIRERLQDAETVFLTQDEDFLFGESVSAIVIVSRVRQSRRPKERIEIWCKAVAELVDTPKSSETLFELTDDGVLVSWRDAQSQS